MKSRAGVRKSRGTVGNTNARRRPARHATASDAAAVGGAGTKKSRRKADDRSAEIGAGTEQSQCAHCEQDLTSLPKALYVEEEVGRVFCSEDCITAHFQPEIQKLEKEYLRFRPDNDLAESDRERLDHLRWMTLEQPDEVWREKTLAGDLRYTLISEFAPDNRRVWSVCVCLFLRGEPSFLFISFPTTSRALTDRFRRGERVEWSKVAAGGASSDSSPRGGNSRGSAAGGGAGKKGKGSESDPGAKASSTDGTAEPGSTDGLAGDWTVEETVRARMLKSRRKNDIPPDQFELFEACLQETVESPEEVWSMPLEKVLAAFDPASVSVVTPAASADGIDEAGEVGEIEGEQDGEVDADEAVRSEALVYVFIKSYTKEARPYWFVAIARDTEEEGQIEVIENFPTRDKGLVDRLRTGTQEYGDDNDLPVYSRMVH